MEYTVSSWGIEPPDFRTHLNYLSCVESLADSLSITLSQDFRSSLTESKKLQKKLTLIKLTKKAIEGELATVNANNEYAELCVSWISVKAYYLFFNLIQILSYLMEGQETSLSQTHNGNRKWLKDAISDGRLVFNNRIFNKIFNSGKIFTKTVRVGSNLKISNVEIVPRIISVLKKIVDYQIQQLVYDKKIKSFRTKDAKALKADYLENETVNLCEFFYWYRIKANYRDLEFLNHDISTSSYVEYYKKYYSLIMKFYVAFEDQINKLSAQRIGKAIL